MRLDYYKYFSTRSESPRVVSWRLALEWVGDGSIPVEDIPKVVAIIDLTEDRYFYDRYGKWPHNTGIRVERARKRGIDVERILGPEWVTLVTDKLSTLH